MSKVYQELAQLVQARATCAERGNDEWFAKHTTSLRKIVRETMPSGSGFDSGTALDLDASTPDKLVFIADYHHMNSDGYYDGWTSHTYIVRPSLAFGFYLRITGPDRDGFKEFAHDVFQFALDSEYIDQPGKGQS